jgi:hypothetical protein
MRRAVVSLIVIALVAAACGDSGGDGGELSAAEQTLADAIAAEIMVDADPDSPLGQVEAQCVGDAAVRELGIDGLLEIGFTSEGESPENILDEASPEQRQQIIDITLECVDFAAVMVEAIAEDGSISEESATCIGDGLTEGNLLEPLVVSGLEGTSFDDVIEQDPDTATAFLEVFLECLSAEELAQLGGS